MSRCLFKSLCLFTEDTIIFVENLMEATEKLLLPMRESSKVAEYKSNIQKLIVFLDTTN